MVEIGNGRMLGQAIVAAVACCILSACGSDEGSGASASTAPTSPPASATEQSSPTASALAISGSPTVRIQVGAAYSFVPALNSGDGATFSISNKPAWATFSVATGALSGTPTASDVGNFAGIVITANSASSSAALAPFSIAVEQVAASTPSTTVATATLNWLPPTANTDGSSLSNLSGYNIYYGASADQLNNKIQVTNPGLTAYTVGGLGAGTHFFGITAYSSNGSESELAVVGSKTIM